MAKWGGNEEITRKSADSPLVCATWREDPFSQPQTPESCEAGEVLLLASMGPGEGTYHKRITHPLYLPAQPGFEMTAYLL